jgi:hypothetical protein
VAFRRACRRGSNRLRDQGCSFSHGAGVAIRADSTCGTQNFTMSVSAITIFRPTPCFPLE